MNDSLQSLRQYRKSLGRLSYKRIFAIQLTTSPFQPLVKAGKIDDAIKKKANFMALLATYTLFMGLPSLSRKLTVKKKCLHPHHSTYYYNLGKPATFFMVFTKVQTNSHLFHRNNRGYVVLWLDIVSGTKICRKIF